MKFVEMINKSKEIKFIKYLLFYADKKTARKVRRYAIKIVKRKKN